MTFDVKQYQYQYQYLINEEKDKKEKYDAFKKRIAEFKKVRTLAEAKELGEKILPTANEINRFDIGNAKCVVINKEDRYRITLDSLDEFICYDFV